MNQTNATIFASALVLFDEAENRLLKAQTAYNQNMYGEAFGQSTAAIVIAENAEHVLEGE